MVPATASDTASAAAVTPNGWRVRVKPAGGPRSPPTDHRIVMIAAGDLTRVSPTGGAGREKRRGRRWGTAKLGPEIVARLTREPMQVAVLYVRESVCFVTARLVQSSPTR